LFCWKKFCLGRSFEELCAGVLLLERALLEGNLTGRELCARRILLQIDVEKRGSRKIEAKSEDFRVDKIKKCTRNFFDFIGSLI